MNSKIYCAADDDVEIGTPNETTPSHSARMLQKVLMDKYKLNETRLHSTYEMFVIGEISEIQIFVLLLLLSGSYAYAASIRKENTIVFICCFCSLLPAWLLLFSLRLKRGLSSAIIMSSGNVTILLHTICIMLVLLFVAAGKLHFLSSKEMSDFYLVSIAAIISLSTLPCVIRCHSPIFTLLAYIIAQVGSVLVPLLTRDSRDITHVALPVFVLVVGFQLFSFERCVLSAYNNLMSLESAVRVSLDNDNQKRVYEMQSAEMRHLIGNVAHDLKTPMQAFSLELNGVSDLASNFLDALVAVDNMEPAKGYEEKNVSLPVAKDFVDETLQGVDTLKSTVHFMLMTINRAIDYTKASAGFELSPSNSTVDLFKAIEWVRQLVANTQPAVPVNFSRPSDLVCSHLITDNQWLIENLLCLVSNAVKFTEEGSVEVSCSLDMSKHKKPLLRFEVEDTGIGINPALKNALFKPFMQAQRCAGGTGLGLYSLSKRCEALGGDYGLSNRHDGEQGCCFWFRIPYVPDLDAAEDYGISSRKRTSIITQFGLKGKVKTNTSVTSVLSPDVTLTENDLPGPVIGGSHPKDSGTTVAVALMGLPSDPKDDSSASRKVVTALLVEDSIVIQKSTKRALSRRSMKVDVAANGSVGLKMMMEKKYDVVLMDLQMPVMDGIESVRRLRAHEMKMKSNDEEKGDGTHQLIIGVSANSDIDTRNEALAVGMDDFLAKPVSVDALRAMCSTHGVTIF